MHPAGDEIANLLAWEGMLLDERRFDDWLALLTEDAWYWVPLHPDQQHPLEGPSHVYDTRDALLARVYRLKDPQNLPQQPPSRCARVVGRPFVVAGEAAGELTVRAPFQLVESLPHHDAEDATRIFAGTITYGLRRQGAELRIRWRRVDLINSHKGLHGVSILV